MKPLPTLMRPLRSVDLATGEPAQALVERSDIAAVEALAVVAEAAVALELARAPARSSAATRSATSSRPTARTSSGSHWAQAARTRSAGDVVLVGFMGAGKSTVGRDAAARLGRRVLDLDREIEERGGRSPSLPSGARPAFREIEEEAARRARGASRA